MSSVPSVELGVLGPLQVREDGAPVAIPGAKPRAILTMLGLHNGSVVPADTLIALLWGDDPPRTAAKALQTHISSLRRALGDGVVVTEGTGWTLRGPEVDATRYKLAAKAGRDAAAAGDTSQAVARFEEALALWRGIPELPEGRRGTSEKTRWIEGYAALVEDRADALLATGRAAELIGELESAVADAPLRERRWAQLMLALYRAGRQGEALAAFQRARALLAEELGVDPGPDLRRLETAIVAQDSKLETPAVQHVPAVTRAVTFLLTDIEGSTAAWEADADAMAVALARHDELVEQVVTSRGGRLIKTRGEGDATFSVFERPSAAATAAIDLQEAISGEPWALREPMRVRVALHTGEVEFRDGDYFGRAVNRAARLRSLAAGGQILCSGATAELVIDSLPDDVVLADLGTRELRNLARPERVFELRLQDAVDVAEPAPTEAPLERPALPAVLAGPGPFVGRVREIAQLFSAWETALAGTTNAALIAGEPGVGKTRLAGEWSQQAYDQGALVIYGRCDEDLGAPYQPFAEALRSLVPCLGADKLRGLRGVEALLTLVPGLTDVVPDLPAPTRADPDTERYALFDAVVAVLGVASRSAPVVLILDDLHWAAKPTLLLLRHLLRFGEQARVQILGTYRSTDLDRSHPLAAMLADLHRDGTANRIALGGLHESDVTAYVAEAGYHDEELARALATVTGGNPFFLIEALRHVEESGGQWDPSTLPQGVREAVSRRLSRLPAEANKALAAAAVVGSRFALELVEHVVGEDLVDAFDEACKAGIVIEEPGGRYRFNHALVRQSLLAELPSMRRMRLHQRIAATLEEQPGADDELLAELAHHYFECAWAGNAAKAVEYCRRAADQAMARLAYEGAADLYDRALHALEEIDEELPDRDEQIAVLLVARCEALLAAGDVTSAVGAVAQLQEATRGSDRLAAWATCFDGQLSLLIHPDRLDEAEAAVSAAAEKLAELADTAGEAKAHTVRAGCLARLGRIGDCEVALDDALTAARRARDHRRVNSVLANAPLAALWGPNPVPRAGGRCLDVVRLLRITTDSPAVEATSTRSQAVLEAFRGRAAAARRMIESARRTVTELGLRHALFEVEQFAGIVELVVDDPAAAEPHLRKAYNGFRRMRLDADTAETAALLGRICLALGRADEADELCTESERLAGHALKASIAWRTLRAQLLSRGNAHDEARRVAEDAVSRAERTDLLVDHGDACLALAGILSAAGNIAGARAAAGQAVSLYERKGAAALVERAQRILGTADVRQPPQGEAGPIGLSNSCTQACSRVVDSVNREAWDEVEQLLAPSVSIESRRKIVGFARIDVPSSQWPEDMRRFLETGLVRYHQTVLAVRGDRLALFRLVLSTTDLSSGAPQDEELQVVRLDDDGRVALQVKFDVEDNDAALAELDAQYATPTEALGVEPDNACARMIRRVSDSISRGDWDEVEELHPSHRVESRRKIVGFMREEFSIGELRRMVVNHKMRLRSTIIAVRGERLALSRLEIGTDDESPGAPHDEMLQLIGLDGDGRAAVEMFFDVEDIDAATAELDALHARLEGGQPHAGRLANTATQVYARLNACFETRAWDAMNEILADDVATEDRRPVVNSVRRQGRKAVVAELSGIAEIGVQSVSSEIIATRGEHLLLSRTQALGRDQRSEGFYSEVFHVVEIDGDRRIAAVLALDPQDLGAALAELDARYVAGEAAANSQTWSAIAAAYANLSRRQLFPTTPEFADIDHRRATPFAPGDLVEYLRAAWDLGVDVKMYVDSVHRLTDLGAVITHTASGTSHEGADVEWREINLVMTDGDKFSRCELFDEADIDAALARFEELSAPPRRLGNAAARVFEHVWSHFVARDWDALAATVADDYAGIDHRRMVKAGMQHGRDDVIRDLQASVDVGFTISMVSAIAIRGERLVLACVRASGSDPGAIQNDVLNVVEIDADERIAAVAVYELEDFGAAIAELDARYLAGEAADHAQTWSAIARAYASIAGRELPATTPDWINVDHRRAAAFAPGDAIAYIRAAWDLTEDQNLYAENVYQLNEYGAVVAHASRGTSHDGFDAEWRWVNIFTVDGERISRTEIFDEIDLDAALAKFDELSRPATQMENAAFQVADRFIKHFTAAEWDAMGEILADNFSSDDRRRVVGAGVRHGRDAEIQDMQAISNLWASNITSTIVATRGTRLVLVRAGFSDRDHGSEAFLTDVLGMVELDADERIVALISFDSNDFEAAIAELDARYLAGEAADHAHTWSRIMAAYAAINRGKLAEFTPDWVNIDHRRAASFAAGDMVAYLRALLDDAPDTYVYIEVVHRLDNRGAVITEVARGTSQHGFQAEWREIAIAMFDGDLLSRYEMFDEGDLDTALAKFEQLSVPTPRLVNAATRAWARLGSCFDARDWDAMADGYAEDHYHDDRRRVTGAGVRHGRNASVENMRVVADLVEKLSANIIAIRGDRLALGRARYWGPQAFLGEMLCVVETNLDDRLVGFVVFDPDDMDVAFEELDARYLAGEATAHAHTWSAVIRSYAALNRRELPAVAPDWLNIDHRRGMSDAPDEIPALLGAAWEDASDLRHHVEAVHRLNQLGTVVTHVGHEFSAEGFHAEFRAINVSTFDGNVLSRSELFDEVDLDAALALFDRLSLPAPRLENRASQIADRVMAHFTAREWNEAAEMVADDYSFDDRRHVAGGVFHGRDVEIASVQEQANLGLTQITPTVIAVRGERIVLSRARYSGSDQGLEVFAAEMLVILEIDADDRLVAAVAYDLEDIDAAFAELDKRYLAGEAAAHAHTWSVIVEGFKSMNRHEVPATTTNFADIDHRPLGIPSGGLGAYLRAGWDEAADTSRYVEAVHRLTDLGAVVTHAASGTSLQDFEAEWRITDLLTVEGDLLSRCELFDETNLEAALARFDELHVRTKTGKRGDPGSRTV